MPESAQGFELHPALPGVKQEAVSVEFLDGQLVVSGSRPNPVSAAKEAAASATAAHATESMPAVVSRDAPTAPKFRRTQTNYGTFFRSFRLPDTVNTKAISAELTNCTLRRTLPFDTEKVTKQHIEIR